MSTMMRTAEPVRGRREWQGRRAVVIVNPVSGDHESSAVDEIERQLVVNGIAPRMTVTTTDRTSGMIAREAVVSGIPLVIVAGGDGTVSEAARELVHQDCTLGIIPLGTFNNIARGLDLPLEIAGACELIGLGRAHSIDVGVLNDVHYFFEAAGIGLEAELFPVGEEIKAGRWTRLLDAARLAFRYRARPVTIEFDRTVAEAYVPNDEAWRPSRRARTVRWVRCRALMTNVANGPYYGGNFTVAPMARFDDGLLTVSIYQNFSKLDLLRHFRSISGGRHRYSPRVEQYRAAGVRITSNLPLPVHADGERMGHVPATFGLVRSALQVCGP